MAITAKTNRNMAILTQQRMRWVEGAFATSGTSVDISVNDFKVITGVFATYIGAAVASDGPLNVNETFTTDHFVLNTAGIVRITRAAGTTSGQKFNVLIIGW